MALAGLEGPKPRERQVVLIVTNLLKQQHLLQRPLDDEISHRALEMFLKNLDPMKVYFYQSDIDEFMQDRDRLDDNAERGDLSFAYKVFNRFLERVEERVAFVDVLLKQEHDFTVDEEMVTDPEEIAVRDNEGRGVRPLAKADQVRPAGAQERRRRGAGGDRSTRTALPQLRQADAAVQLG